MINQTVTIAADKRRNGRDRNDATRTVSFDEWQNVTFDMSTAYHPSWFAEESRDRR